MKIFNIENGIKKVYVQKNDLGILNEINISIPCSIYKIINEIKIIDDTNRFDFIEFSNSDEIKFFEEIDWMIDYKKFRNLSEDEIIDIGKKIQKNMNDIACHFNNMSNEDKKCYYHMLREIEFLDYKLKNLSQLLLIKQNKLSIPFPLIPDSNNFSLSSDKYIIQSSLEANKLLLYKTNGEKLSDKDIIPHVFLQNAIGIAIMSNNNKNSFFGDYTLSNTLSEDEKYLIIEFDVKEYHNTSKKDKNEEKGIKRLIKRIFNKNK